MPLTTISNANEQAQLVTHLVNEGAQVVRNASKTSVIKLRLRDGHPYTIHQTSNNQKTWLKARSELRKHGHSWPGDNTERTREVMKRRTDKQNRAAVEAAIEDLVQHKQPIKVATIAQATGILTSGVKNHLQALGYTPDPNSKYAREWRKSWVTSEEILTAQATIQDRPELLPGTSISDDQEEAIDTADEPVYSEIERARAEAAAREAIQAAAEAEAKRWYGSTAEVITELQEQGKVDQYPVAVPDVSRETSDGFEPQPSTPLTTGSVPKAGRTRRNAFLAKPETITVTATLTEEQADLFAELGNHLGMSDGELIVHALGQLVESLEDF